MAYIHDASSKGETTMTAPRGLHVKLITIMKDFGKKLPGANKKKFSEAADNLASLFIDAKAPRPNAVRTKNTNKPA